MWPFKKKEPIPTDDRIMCLCGAEMVVTDFDVWGIDNEAEHLYGVFSCPVAGCQGNFKERHEKHLAAMKKLTDEEKKLLGLWNWYAEANIPVDESETLP